MKRDVLFVCVHNSARSQMAEGILNDLCPDDFNAESAGLEPGTLSPLAVAAMDEIGIDISSKATKGVFDLFNAGKRYSYVISVCDDANAERCPIFPGHAERLHWSFPDPANLEETRSIRDAIRAKISEWCVANCAAPARLPRSAQSPQR